MATMLVQRGTLHVGDAIVAGDAWGKVRALHDFRGERVKDAKPGTPVEILGFDKPPQAGEHARVVENERQARQLASLRGQRLRAEQLARRGKGGPSLEDLFSLIGPGRRPGPEHRRQGRRPGLARGRNERAREDPAPGGSRQRHPHRASVRSPRTTSCSPRRRSAIVVGFNVRPNAEATRARRPRRRRHPHVPGHLPAHGRHPAGTRRHAGSRAGRGDARRGRGARALPDLPARRHRRVLRHQRRRASQRRAYGSSAKAPSSTRRRSRASSGSRTTSARCRPGSSAASSSKASTTSRKATSSSSSRRVRSHGLSEISWPSPTRPRRAPSPR